MYKFLVIFTDSAQKQVLTTQAVKLDSHAIINYLDKLYTDYPMAQAIRVYTYDVDKQNFSSRMILSKRGD